MLAEAWSPSTHCSPLKYRSACWMASFMKAQPPLENAPGTSCVSITTCADPANWRLKLMGGLLLAGFGQHERVDALGAGELGQVPARFVDRGGVVVLRVRILLLQHVGVEIELLLSELLALRIDGAVVGPPLHQNRRKKLRACCARGGRW